MCPVGKKAAGARSRLRPACINFHGARTFPVMRVGGRGVRYAIGKNPAPTAPRHPTLITDHIRCGGFLRALLFRTPADNRTSAIISNAIKLH
ncbi:unnamed protein product, partial [Iphiclides podalirius]